MSVSTQHGYFKTKQLNESAFLEQVRQNQGIIYKLVGLYAYHKNLGVQHNTQQKLNNQTMLIAKTN